MHQIKKSLVHFGTTGDGGGGVTYDRAQYMIKTDLTEETAQFIGEK